MQIRVIDSIQAKAGIGSFFLLVTQKFIAMTKYIFLDESEFRNLLRQELAIIAQPAPTPTKERYSMDEAVTYLSENGLPITKSTLYQHTSQGTISYGRAGKRKVTFTTEQLDDFLEKMMR